MAFEDPTPPGQGPEAGEPKEAAAEPETVESAAETSAEEPVKDTKPEEAPDLKAEFDKKMSENDKRFSERTMELDGTGEDLAKMIGMSVRELRDLVGVYCKPQKTAGERESLLTNPGFTPRQREVLQQVVPSLAEQINAVDREYHEKRGSLQDEYGTAKTEKLLEGFSEGTMELDAGVE